MVSSVLALAKKLVSVTIYCYVDTRAVERLIFLIVLIARLIILIAR